MIIKLVKKIYSVIIHYIIELYNCINNSKDTLLCSKLKSEYNKLEFENKRICLIVPHIDDDVLGMGGTLNSLDSRNNNILIIYTTDGRKSYHPKMTEDMMKQNREREAIIVKDMFNNINIEFYRFKSIEWDINERFIEILECIKKWNPNVIFFPSIYDNNIDHIKNALCVSRCVIDLNQDIKYYMFQIQTPICEDNITHIYVLTERDVEKKKDCLEIYSSQYIMKKSFVKVVRYNCLLGRNIKKAGAELFQEMSTQKIVELYGNVEGFYNKKYPIFTHGCSIVNVVKMNNIIQNNR